MKNIVITDGIKFLSINEKDLNGIVLRSAKAVIIVNGLLELVYMGKYDTDKEKISSLLSTRETKNLFEYTVK